MGKRIGDVLNRESRCAHPGDTMLPRLAVCLERDGPLVVWLHGPVGAGKSTLLARFLDQAASRGFRAYRVDCRTVEPTVKGVLAALTVLMGRPLDSIEALGDAISGTKLQVVLAFDHYEAFRLADGWLRRDLIPALPDSARVLLTSREPPAAGWVSAAEWRPYFLPVAVMQQGAVDAEALTQHCLDAIREPAQRDALDAASVVRRFTRPLLAELCADADHEQVYEALAGLACVERRSDGLAVHDATRHVIATRLRSADPERYRAYQSAAWRHFHGRLKTASHADLWRYTADVIYLIENPVIREAFFPTTSAEFYVEPALPAHHDPVMAIARTHESASGVAALALWWACLPSAFHVVCDASGTVVGFYCMARPDELRADWMRNDPVARAWQDDLSCSGVRGDKPSLFLRRWLSADDGEIPSPVQAAAWVDIKRTYLELRPALRRVYLALRDVAPYAAVATRLGFRVLEKRAAMVGSTTYYTAMLDFGPGSVDGWLCNLVAAELGVEDERLVDAASRELVLDGTRIPLTPLEFGVVSLLETHAGEAVSREELLRAIWGRQYDGSSNVVDVVVRGIRKKCGTHPDLLETVRGVGYRLKA